MSRRWIIFACLLALESCGSDLAPADSTNLIRHNFLVEDQHFSVLLPANIQPMSSRSERAEVVFSDNERQRVIQYIRFLPSDASTNADYSKVISLESSAVLGYKISQPKEIGSGGPEVVLMGELDFGNAQIKVECHTQHEWEPKGQWCIPFLHHVLNQQADSSVVVETATPPLIEATLAGNSEVVSRLLEQGTDPNLVYNTNTALTYAARDGFTDIARLLIDHGANVNWIDGEGVTPLILASFKDHIELVELLLAHGADTTIRDQWNRTALDYALRRGPADPIVQLLRERP